MILLIFRNGWKLKVRECDEIKETPLAEYDGLYKRNPTGVIRRNKALCFKLIKNIIDEYVFAQPHAPPCNEYKTTTCLNTSSGASLTIYIYQAPQ